MTSPQKSDLDEQRVVVAAVQHYVFNTLRDKLYPDYLVARDTGYGLEWPNKEWYIVVRLRVAKVIKATGPTKSKDFKINIPWEIAYEPKGLLWDPWLQGYIDKIKLQFAAPKEKLPDGGASSYYDLPPNCLTLNDILEWKGKTSWLGDSFHLANVMKAAFRWGEKAGTSKDYDARKFIYSGARLLQQHGGQQALRDTLQAMLDDKQFGGPNA